MSPTSRGPVDALGPKPIAGVSEDDQAGMTTRQQPQKTFPQGPVERVIGAVIQMPTFEFRDPLSLRLDTGNPRIFDQSGIDDLRDSFLRYGFPDPIVILPDGRVIGGHARARAAIAAGMPLVPVAVHDIDPGLAGPLGVKLNTHVGRWDDPLLAARVAAIQADGLVDVATLGLEDGAVRRLLAQFEALDARDRRETFDLDAALAEAGRQARVHLGDHWRLGRHRLICGDSTDETVINRLLGADRPNLCVTDPPFGVAYGDHGGRARGRRRRVMLNDNLDAESWAAFVARFSKVIVENTDGAIYLFMSSKELPLVSQLLAQAGAHWSDYVVWVKRNGFVLGRADHQRQFEIAFYGWREGATRTWTAGRNVSDVWEFDRPTDAPLHPTSKPVPLLMRMIENSSHPGDLVFDPFGGSGSTLIAAERTGRDCAIVELDPAYAAVIVARYEAFAGAPAELVDRLGEPDGLAQ